MIGDLLGGVKDVDGDTYVKPESSPASDEDALTFFTAGTERAVIDSDGNVGIATTNPTATLDVDGTLNVSGVSNVSGNVKLAKLQQHQRDYQDCTLREIVPELIFSHNLQFQ